MWQLQSTAVKHYRLAWISPDTACCSVVPLWLGLWLGLDLTKGSGQLQPKVVQTVQQHRFIMNLSGYVGHATVFRWMFSITSCLVCRVGIRIRVKVRFSVWTVSCYAHVFVLVSVVTLPHSCARAHELGNRSIAYNCADPMNSRCTDVRWTWPTIYYFFRILNCCNAFLGHGCSSVRGQGVGMSCCLPHFLWVNSYFFAGEWIRKKKWGGADWGPTEYPPLVSLPCSPLEVRPRKSTLTLNCDISWQQFWLCPPPRKSRGHNRASPPLQKVEGAMPACPLTDLCRCFL